MSLLNIVNNHRVEILSSQVYEETRRNILQGKDIHHEVIVLQGGFSQFQAKYKVSPIARAECVHDAPPPPSHRTTQPLWRTGIRTFGRQSGADHPGSVTWIVRYTLERHIARRMESVSGFHSPPPPGLYSLRR